MKNALLRLLTTLAVSAGCVSAAQAQFAPQVSGDDIEGAIMPAVPFPKNEKFAIERPASGQAPASMGLAPMTSDTPSGNTPAPIRSRRPLSAQETADLLLR
jgi:hypothetical protein